MSGSKTISVSVYTHIGGLPKNKVKPFIPVGSLIVKDPIIFDDKYASFLKKKEHWSV